MNTDLIIMACEGMWTATKRAGINSDLKDEHRTHVRAMFDDLATNLELLAEPTGSRPEWEAVHEAVVHLHTAAVTADELRVGSFEHVSIATVRQRLAVLANTLGYRLEDAATAPLDDDAALAAVEGGEPERMAAE